MTKLIDSVRVPKNINKLPKQKKRLKKDYKDIKFSIIQEDDKEEVNEFIKGYKKDAFKARVKFFNESKKYSFRRTVIFEYPNSDFEIAQFKITHGISITNKMYSSQKKLNSIIYKQGKFYILERKTHRSSADGI